MQIALLMFDGFNELDIQHNVAPAGAFKAVEPYLGFPSAAGTSAAH